MGQKLARPPSMDSSGTETHLSSGDELDSVATMTSRAESLGIPVFKSDDPELIKRLISVHTDALMSARGRSRKSGKRISYGSRKSVASRSPSLVLRTLRTIPGRMGCDIGGTCAKLVLMMSAEEAREVGKLPETFGTTGKVISDLEEVIQLRSGTYVLQFIAGETTYLEKLIQNLAGRPMFQDLPSREIIVAGGGAHKYAELFKEALNFEFKQCPEMLSVVEGLRFVLQHRLHFPDEVFRLNEKKQKETVRGPLVADRFLVVNMGSGVSILEVTSDNFRRIGGSACGGATFLGLSRLLAGSRSYDEALNMAEEGDGRGINKLVSDIYGNDGSAALGLHPSLTASNFGKVGGEDMSNWTVPEKTDVCRALLEMVIQGTCVLASAFSTTMDISTIFFTGGFLRDNKIAIQLLSQSMKNLGAQAYFCKHSDFLGALGSLKISLPDDGILSSFSDDSGNEVSSNFGNEVSSNGGIEVSSNGGNEVSNSDA